MQNISFVIPLKIREYDGKIPEGISIPKEFRFFFPEIHGRLSKFFNKFLYEFLKKNLKESQEKWRYFYWNHLWNFCKMAAVFTQAISEENYRINHLTVFLRESMKQFLVNFRRRNFWRNIRRSYCKTLILLKGCISMGEYATKGKEGVKNR